MPRCTINAKRNGQRCACSDTLCTSSSGYICSGDSPTCNGGPQCEDERVTTANCMCGSQNCAPWELCENNQCRNRKDLYRKFSYDKCTDHGLEPITDNSECLVAMRKAAGVYTDGIKEYTNSQSKPLGCYTDGDYAYMNSGDGTCDSFGEYCLCKFSGPICPDGSASTTITEKCICRTSVCTAGQFCAYNVNECFDEPKTMCETNEVAEKKCLCALNSNCSVGQTCIPNTWGNYCS